MYAPGNTTSYGMEMRIRQTSHVNFILKVTLCLCLQILYGSTSVSYNIEACNKWVDILTK